MKNVHATITGNVMMKESPMKYGEKVSEDTGRFQIYQGEKELPEVIGDIDKLKNITVGQSVTCEVLISSYKNQSGYVQDKIQLVKVVNKA